MSLGELYMEAARNNSCVITIVDYHGNSVYRVVASIPVWVTCGRFPWKVPTRKKYETIFLPVVLYRHDAWRLKIHGNTVLRRIMLPKEDEILGA
jgi:hypothetical protein